MKAMKTKKATNEAMQILIDELSATDLTRSDICRIVGRTFGLSPLEAMEVNDCITAAKILLAVA